MLFFLVGPFQEGPEVSKVVQGSEYASLAEVPAAIHALKEDLKELDWDAEVEVWCKQAFHSHITPLTANRSLLPACIEIFQGDLKHSFVLQIWLCVLQHSIQSTPNSSSFLLKIVMGSMKKSGTRSFWTLPPCKPVMSAAQCFWSSPLYHRKPDCWSRQCAGSVCCC